MPGLLNVLVSEIVDSVEVRRSSCELSVRLILFVDSLSPTMID